MKWMVVILFLFLLGIIAGIRIISPTEKGLRIFFGRILPGVCESGLNWMVRLPHCGIIRITKERFKLDYAPRVVISKMGKRGGDKYEKQFLIVNVVIYTEFGGEFESLKNAAEGETPKIGEFESLKNAIERKTPKTAEGLKEYTDGLIDSALRQACGSMDWAKATEEKGRDIIKNTLKDRINNPSSIFQLGGLNAGKTEVAIKTVDIQSEELKKAMTRPDIQRLQKKGAVDEAGRVKITTEVLGDIGTSLIKKEFPPEIAYPAALSIYELQRMKDLMTETGKDAFKVIRFETGDKTGNLNSFLAQGVAAFMTAIESIKEKPKEKPKEKEEEKNLPDLEEVLDSIDKEEGKK